MFLNLIMLAGLGGALVPLVLHLLSRARHRRVAWGAMMFLPGSAPRQRNPARLRQLGLLLLRMGIVALLAIALARPVLSSGGGWAAEPGGVTAVIVVDCSASMGYDEHGRTRIAGARDLVLQILAGLRPADAVALIEAGPRPVTSAEPTRNHAAVAARIAELKPRPGAADLAGAVRAAADLFDRHRAARPELFLVCDRQAANWTSISDQDAGELRRALSGSGARFRGFVLPVGGSDASNVAVASIEVARPPLIRGQPNELRVALRNEGPVPRSELSVLASVDGQAVAGSMAYVGPDSTATVHLPLKIDEPGSYHVSVSVRSAGLTADDQLEAPVQVVEPIRTLIVSGDERADPRQSESFFLRPALTPFASSGSSVPDLCVVETVPADQWDARRLDEYQVLVLANVRSLSEDQVERIERFASRGGGVLIGLGDRIDPDLYNRRLHRGGEGLLPAELHGRVEPDSPVAVHAVQAAGALGAVAHDPLPQGLRPLTMRYFHVHPPTPTASILSRYGNGDPAMIESAFGQGRVLLLTTSLDVDWTNLPLTGAYLPLVQGAVSQLAAGVRGSGARPGDPASAPLESALRTLPSDALAQHADRLGLELLEIDQNLSGTSLTSGRGGDELWAVLLVVVLGLAWIEMLAVRRWTEEPR